MSVITISRGSFSGGKKLAESLARQLNYRCIDRDVVIQRTSIKSISPNEIFAALDTPPTSELYTLNHRKYIYLTLIQAAIVEEVSAGNAVYHGLAGHLLLQEVFPALRLRVIAPLEYRIRVAQERMKISREQAMAHIEKMDDHRGKWTRYLYGVDWEDPSLYDLVFNLEHISVEQACHVIGAMIKEGGFEASTKHPTEINDFILAVRVRAALAKDALTSNLEVEVKARAGKVTIKGELFEETDEVQRVVAKVPHVVSIHLEELPAAPGSASSAPPNACCIS